MATPTAPAPKAAPAAPAATPAQGQAQPGSAAAQAGKQAQGQAAPTAAEIRKLKLKLDGQDVELPESEVIALAQQGKVSGKRFQEAAALRREAESIIRFAKENPKEFFAKTGMNAREWAEQYLMEEIKREQMSPEQKKALENEEKLKQYEREKLDAKKKAEHQEQEELKRKHMENYDRLFVEALTKSGLPKTPFTVKRMAELQLVNLRKKLELSADQLAKVVREDYISEQKALFGQVDGDQLIEILGPEIVKKLSKAQIAKLKGKKLPSGGSTAGSGSNPRVTTQDRAGMTWKEYQRRNRRLT